MVVVNSSLQSYSIRWVFFMHYFFFSLDIPSAPGNRDCSLGAAGCTPCMCDTQSAQEHPPYVFSDRAWSLSQPRRACVPGPLISGALSVKCVSVEPVHFLNVPDSSFGLGSTPRSRGLWHCAFPNTRRRNPHGSDGLYPT